VVVELPLRRVPRAVGVDCGAGVREGAVSAKGELSVANIILWRWTTLPGRSATPHEVADSLTVEGLPYEEIPPRFRAAVTKFRHLRRDARVAACRRVLEGL